LKLLTFKHGVHPAEQKQFTASNAIEELPLPDEVFIPLHQHIGAPCKALVDKKDEVKTGQVIGKASGYISSPVHASVTGTVKAVGLFFNQMGVRVPMVHIQRTGDDDWEYLPKPDNWETASADDLAKLVFDAGIVGMGGAAFPTHVKLKAPPDKPIDSLILNGCECEPYLTCDHRLMLEKTDRLLLGMAITMKTLGVSNGYIGIEQNKPDAIDIIQQQIKANGYDFHVVPLKVKYPQGAERMLIKAILKRSVPAPGLPGDVGVIVSNVGTAHAVMEAVVEGKPLINRILTVTGDAVKQPKNLQARVGTPVKNAVEFCGGLDEETAQVFMGGPMMGVSQFDLDVPIIKATSGVVGTLQVKEWKQKEYPCIRCNSCVSSCPVFLLPNRLSRLAEVENYEEADRFGVLNCIECGSCTFVCPSHIPILQYMRVGKFRVNELKRKAAV